MKSQLQEDIYVGTYGREEISDIETTEGDVLAQLRDVIERNKK